MPRVHFTSHLRRYLPCESVEVAAPNVAEALEAVFAIYPGLRGYVLDDHGCVRQHVIIFVDDRPLSDRTKLSDAVQSESQIHVLQALSGG